MKNLNYITSKNTKMKNENESKIEESEDTLRENFQPVPQDLEN